MLPESMNMIEQRISGEQSKKKYIRNVMAKNKNVMHKFMALLYQRQRGLSNFNKFFAHC